MQRPRRAFCDFPFLEVAALRSEAIDVAVFGAGHGTSYTPGTPSHSAEAPQAIRDSLEGIDILRGQIDMDYGTPLMGAVQGADLGDVEGDPDDTGRSNQARIRETTRAVLDQGVVPIVLGGDDNIPIPFIEAFDRPLWVVQMDAHLDWRDEVGGVTHGYSSTMRRASEMAHVAGIVQIGARGVGSARAGELAAARDWGARIFPMRAVHREGLAPAISAVPEGADILLTMDADGLDPALCPGVMAPTPGGLGYQQMLDLIEGLAARGRIVGATMVEYAPARDVGGLGAMALARLVCNLIAALGR